MLEFLSPREMDEVLRAADRGAAWARIVTTSFLDGARLRLGIDQAVPETAVAAAAGLDPHGAQEALHEAALWCVRHGLHLLGFPSEDAEGWSHFMAVG